MIAGKHILIVEDEFLVSAMLEDQLADAGAIVVGPAASLGEGLRLAAEGGFDAAVVDWNLDGESSEALGDALLAAGIPFVISTGYGAVPARFSGTAMLGKPYDPEALVKLLDGMLA